MHLRSGQGQGHCIRSGRELQLLARTASPEYALMHREQPTLYRLMQQHAETIFAQAGAEACADQSV